MGNFAFDPFSAVGSLISGIFTSVNQHNQNEYNAEEAEKSRNWSAEQNSTQRWWQSNENTKAYERQLSMQEQGQSWQEKMWNLENQYNSPSAMMQRFREAGLNPFLSMGQSILGNASSPVPTAAMSGAPPATGSSMLGGDTARSSGLVNWNFDSLLSGIGVKANAANQRAQSLDQLYRTYKFIDRYIGHDSAVEFKSKYIDSQSSDDPDSSREGMRYQKEMLSLDLANQRSQFDLAMDRGFSYRERSKNLKLVEKTIDHLSSQIDRLSKQNEESDANISLANAQVKRVSSEIARNFADAFKLKHEGGYFLASANQLNTIRGYVLAKLRMENSILARVDKLDSAYFSSNEELIEWLGSAEAKKAFKDAARISGVWNADPLRRSLLDIFRSMPIHIGGFAGSGVQNTDFHGSSGSNSSFHVDY